MQYSQRYLVLGLVGLGLPLLLRLGLADLALRLVAGIALNTVNTVVNMAP